jgi:hypothetical protein
LLVGVGRGDLVVGGDGVGLVRAVERALRAGDVGAGDRVAQVLHRDAVGGEPRQIGLDAHRRLDAALHETRPTPEIWLSRCASSVSARSLIARSEIVSEVSASVRIGASAGFTLA